MTELFNLFCCDIRRRIKDSFLIGYNIVFPIIMILLLGYLSSPNYGSKFTGYHYYTIVMLPFCIAMAVITTAYVGKEDAYKKTAIRFLFSPVTPALLILARLLSCTVVISCCNLIVLIFSLLAFKMPIGNHILEVTGFLASETFTVCAIGLFIGLGMKNFIFIKNIINIPICAAAVLAGAFFPFGTLNSGLEFIIKLSPLTWFNRSMFQSIYDGQYRLMIITSIISIVIGISFTILAICLFRKEEFIHGDLPGYGK
jgi:ABC-2 type transport system permease protein